MDIDDRKLVAWINPTDGSTPILTVDAVTNNTRIGSHGASVVFDKPATISIAALDNTPIGQTTPAVGTFSTVNTWPITFAATDQTVLVSGGTGHAAGDVLTLPNGVLIGVTVVAGGVITSFHITNRGSAPTAIPSNPAAQVSSTGSGVGASFTLSWAPRVLYDLGGTLTSNSGSLFIGGEQNTSTRAESETTYVGIRAGGGFATGGFNVAVGHNAGGIGTALGAATNSGNSVFLGADAGRNITGSFQGVVAVGANAGRNNAASNNVFIGSAAGKGPETGLATGTQNIGIGTAAVGGASNMTTAFSNVGVGDSTGTALTTGSANVMVGNHAGLVLTQGASNTLVGANAGLAMTTGGSNTCIGATAGGALIGTSNNVFVGANAGSTATCAGSTCVGISAGTATGNDNAMLGQSAGTKFTGNQNTIVGSKAGSSASGAGANNNVLLGYQAGLVMTSAAQNTIIGASVASTTLATGAGNIVIGTDNHADTAGAATADSLVIQGRGTTATIRATSIASANPLVTVDGTLTVGTDFVDPGVKRVTAQTDVSASTTLTTVTGLSKTLAAAGTYAFRAYLPMTVNATPGAKIAVGTSDTLTATSINYMAQLWNGATISGAGTSTALGTAAVAVTAAGTFATIDGVIVVNAAGTLTVQIAQNVSNATATSALVNGYLTVSRIS